MVTMCNLSLVRNQFKELSCAILLQIKNTTLIPTPGLCNKVYRKPDYKITNRLLTIWASRKLVL